MKTLLSKEELIAFEEDIANSFNNKEIKAPIHLDNGNEEQMIEVFKEVNENDWCFGTWRSHYICLLKGVPQKQLKTDILKGKSITLCYPEYNIFSSAIVGGNISIALGTALDIKRKGQQNKVWCFLGDMSTTCGIFSEALEYAENFDLPITFVVSDNNKSVLTDTRQVWNTTKLPFEPFFFDGSDNEEEDFNKGKLMKASKRLYWYKYNSKWPHSGGNQRINF